MSKTFTCCELIQALKDWQNNPKSKWTDEQKYFASEIFDKVGSEFWDDHCESCSAWFKEQAKKQGALIEAEIEKEKAEGKYYGPRKPLKKSLEKFKNQADEYQKSLEEDKSVLLSFDKSPQE